MPEEKAGQNVVIILLSEFFQLIEKRNVWILSSLVCEKPAKRTRVDSITARSAKRTAR